MHIYNAKYSLSTFFTTVIELQQTQWINKYYMWKPKNPVKIYSLILTIPILYTAVHRNVYGNFNNNVFSIRLRPTHRIINI